MKKRIIFKNFNKVNKTQTEKAFGAILTLILLAGKKKEISFSNF